MAFENVPLEVRLINGAKTLGVLYRAGQRCGAAGWSWSGSACECVTKTKFCVARTQWMALAVSGGREISLEPSGILHTMTVAEINACAITVSIDLVGLGNVKVGPKGEMPWKDFLELAKNPVGIESVFKVLRAFPGSKVIETLPPAAAAV